MALTFLFALGFTIFIIFLSTIISQFYRTRKSHISSNPLPPGRTGWPIIGETLDYISSREKFIRDRMIKYSPDIFKTSILGEKNVAVLCGPSANKFIFSNEAKFFTPCLPLSLTPMVFATHIPKTSPWTKKLVEETHKSLKVEALQHYVSIMDTKARDHIKAHWAPYNEVKVHPLSREFSFSLACSLFINYQGWDQVRELAEPFFQFSYGSELLPVSFPGTPLHRARKREEVALKKVANIVRERILELRNGDVDGRDILSRVLMMCSNENGIKINEREIAGFIISLLFASFHSTSTTITFVLGQLAQYPHVYEKVLQEQLEVVQSKGKDKLLTWKDIQKMKYSWNVVCETMRLIPPAQGNFREVIADFTYAGFKVPKGWKIRERSIYVMEVSLLERAEQSKNEPNDCSRMAILHNCSL